MVRMDRRRFLRLGVGAAILAGSAIVGLEYMLPRKPEIGSSSTQLYSIKGRVPFDYNGNAKQDGDEPPVQNAKVQIMDKTSSKIINPPTLTDSSGDYKVDIPAGNYKLLIKPDQTKPDSPKFGYMCRSPAEFRAIEDGYDLTVVGNGRFDVGLMEGFLTLSASTKTEYSIGRFYDHDPTIGRVLWWNGKSYQYNNPLQGAWDDSHTGTDYDMNYGEKILAPAPGIVVYLRNGSIGESSEESSNLTEMDIEYSNGFRTALFHFSKSLVNVNDKVVRGQPVAEVGDLGTFYPHSHEDLYKPSKSGPILLDPYQSIFRMESKFCGYWSNDNNHNKFWVSISPDSSDLILDNHWTKYNKPQHPY